MTREELVTRMSWHEFQMWAVITAMDQREQQSTAKPMRQIARQTPEQMLAFLDMAGSHLAN